MAAEFFFSLLCNSREKKHCGRGRNSHFIRAIKAKLTSILSAFIGGHLARIQPNLTADLETPLHPHPSETCQCAVPLYLGATAAPSRQPHILKWSRSESGVYPRTTLCSVPLLHGK